MKMMISTTLWFDFKRKKIRLPFLYWGKYNQGSVPPYRRKHVGVSFMFGTFSVEIMY